MVSSLDNKNKKEARGGNSLNTARRRTHGSDKNICLLGYL